MTNRRGVLRALPQLAGSGWVRAGVVAGGLHSEFLLWWRSPVRARLYSGAVVLAGLVATAVAIPALQDPHNVLVVTALMVVAIVNGELGRLAEGRRVDQDRPHKGLSA